MIIKINATVCADMDHGEDRRHKIAGSDQRAESREGRKDGDSLGRRKFGSLAEALVLQAMTVRRCCDGLWTALFHSSGLSLLRRNLSLVPMSDRLSVWLGTVARRLRFGWRERNGWVRRLAGSEGRVMVPGGGCSCRIPLSCGPSRRRGRMWAEAERTISAAGHVIVDMILPSLAILSHGTMIVMGRGPDPRIFMSCDVRDDPVALDLVCRCCSRQRRTTPTGVRCRGWVSEGIEALAPVLRLGTCRAWFTTSGQP